MIYTNNNLSNHIDNLLNHPHIDFNFLSKNEDDTKFLADLISNKIKKSDIIVLNGELGSGKTAFMHGVAKHFNIEDQICSPTFTIVNEYTNKNNDYIYHFDVYRLEDEIEFIEQIGTHYFENGICFIEWGEIIKNILPKNTIYVDIKKDENEYETRHIHVWRK